MDRSIYKAEWSIKKLHRCIGVCGWKLRQVFVIGLITMLTFSAFSSIYGQGDGIGRIIGRLSDSATGDALIAANVYLEGTVIGTATDFDGFFMVDNVPPGTYIVIVSTIGYAETRIPEVAVTAGKSTKLDEIKIKPAVIEGEEVTVEARFIQNTEASLLSKRLQDDAISDGLSAEAISRTGVDEAGEAMQQVTGASVLDGKYVYIRGLGDRYASTQLNGAELPSADPETRSFNFDLIPAGMLDNVVTTKTFTPDQPGNFSGGVVNFGTKNYPDEFLTKASIGLNYNTQASLNSNFLTYSGGGTDWLGFDDGTRELPEFFRENPDTPLPTESQARRDPEQAALLDEASNAFSPTMAPSTMTSPLNGKFAFAIGDQSPLGSESAFGWFASLNYNREFSSYEDGTVARWKLTGAASEKDSLDNQTNLIDNRGVESILWGGMATASMLLSGDHEVKLNFLRTQSGTNEARYLNGLSLIHI